MKPWKRSLLVTLLAAVSLALVPALQAQQSLEELVDQSQEEEQQIETIPGTDIPAPGDETMTGRIRLPAGEEVERLRISQDREIDPQVYIVGPGDAMQLYIWGEFDLSYMLQVDPEGNVLIATVGSLHVSGLTLSEAKRQIHHAAQSKYPGVDVTISLVSMRFFTAYLTGAVLREGSFVVNPTTRISDLIERAGGYLDELRGRTIEEEVAGKKVTRVRQIQTRPTGRRSIQLLHGDGSAENVDLEMFHATGGVKHNPYVRMGDVVHVGYRRGEVYIHGEVNRTGTYEYLEGDTLGDLIDLAKGVRTDVPLERVEVWRFVGSTEEPEVVVLGDAADGGGPLSLDGVRGFELRPKDMVLVRGRVGWQRVPTVWISGQVQLSGRYRIVPQLTRLMDVIEQAGGLREDASLIGAKVVRMRLRGVRDPELERLAALQRVTGLADMSPEDRAYLKTKGREERGRVAVDFERLFYQSDEEQNILLESGDVIFIPERRRTISISGQVKKPGLVDFEDGQTVSFYLEKAGGYSYGANQGGARLIKSRSGVRERLQGDLLVEAGDEIWVPEKEYRDWWALFQGTMRTMAEALTLVILVRTL